MWLKVNQTKYGAHKIEDSPQTRPFFVIAKGVANNHLLEYEY